MTAAVFFIPCIVPVDHLVLGNSWRAESAAVDERENAAVLDCYLQTKQNTTAHAHVQVTVGNKPVIQGYLFISRLQIQI